MGMGLASYRGFSTLNIKNHAINKNSLSQYITASASQCRRRAVKISDNRAHK
jgi:hypothetical protein